MKINIFTKLIVAVILRLNAILEVMIGSRKCNHLKHFAN